MIKPTQKDVANWLTDVGNSAGTEDDTLVVASWLLDAMMLFMGGVRDPLDVQEWMDTLLLAVRLGMHVEKEKWDINEN